MMNTTRFLTVIGFLCTFTACGELGQSSLSSESSGVERLGSYSCKLEWRQAWVPAATENENSFSSNTATLGSMLDMTVKGVRYFKRDVKLNSSVKALEYGESDMDTEGGPDITLSPNLVNFKIKIKPKGDQKLVQDVGYDPQEFVAIEFEAIHVIRDFNRNIKVSSLQFIDLTRDSFNINQEVSFGPLRGNVGEYQSSEIDYDEGSVLDSSAPAVQVNFHCQKIKKQETPSEP